MVQDVGQIITVGATEQGPVGRPLRLPSRPGQILYLELDSAHLPSTAQRPVVHHTFPDDGFEIGCQYRLESADVFLELFYPLFHSGVSVILHSIPIEEMDYAYDGLFLADPVNTTNPLFQAHRVPRYVVVDDRGAELEVQGLGGGLGT